MWIDAVENDCAYAFLELDRGSGDAGGCDGKECSEELSGDKHRR